MSVAYLRDIIYPDSARRTSRVGRYGARDRLETYLVLTSLMFLSFGAMFILAIQAKETTTRGIVKARAGLAGSTLYWPLRSVASAFCLRVT